jgi:transposase
MAKRGRRRRFAAADKVAILKRHLVGKEEVSKICEELKLHPNQFYEWQRQFFEQGVKAFESDEKREESKLRTQVASLEARLQRKDSVLSELIEAHMSLKKSLGED